MGKNVEIERLFHKVIRAYSLGKMVKRASYKEKKD